MLIKNVVVSLKKAKIMKNSRHNGHCARLNHQNSIESSRESET